MAWFPPVSEQACTYGNCCCDLLERDPLCVIHKLSGWDSNDTQTPELQKENKHSLTFFFYILPVPDAASANFPACSYELSFCALPWVQETQKTPDTIRRTFPELDPSKLWVPSQMCWLPISMILFGTYKALSLGLWILRKGFASTKKLVLEFILKILYHTETKMICKGP